MLCRIGNRDIGPGQPCFLIAEAGVNHNGDLAIARSLIDAAADAGVDAVKFQSFRADDLAQPQAQKPSYQKQTTDPDESPLTMLRRLELNAAAHQELLHYCQRRNLLFLSTPYDLHAVDLLEDMQVPAYKVASGDLNNTLLLERLALTRKPLILSTGMSYLSEVEHAVRVLQHAESGPVVLMHCVSCYPAPLEHANLRVLRTMRQAFNLPVGYSDHAMGPEAALAAVALGAAILEKHFTMDRSLPGPDHSASLQPDELQQLVRSVRRVEAALGDGVKQPTLVEQENRQMGRRSLVAAEDIAAGTVLGREQLAAKRPAGVGLAPDALWLVIGRRTRAAIAVNTPIQLEMLE